MSSESALVVLLPEVESLVESFRQQFDPSAAIGVPAHVTLLYPFKPPTEITEAILSALAEIFNRIPTFSVSFAEILHFPDTIFLAPEPAEPFRQMTRMLANRFPETPPYGGTFQKIVPHLTVAQMSDPDKLAEITADFERAAADQLPIHAKVDRVSLLENSIGFWRASSQFSLFQED